MINPGCRWERNGVKPYDVLMWAFRPSCTLAGIPSGYQSWSRWVRSVFIRFSSTYRVRRITGDSLPASDIPCNHRTRLYHSPGANAYSLQNRGVVTNPYIVFYQNRPNVEGAPLVAVT